MNGYNASSTAMMPAMTAFSFEPDNYQLLLEQKQQRLAELLAPFSPPSITCFASDPEHFRMRAEFRIWHTGDIANYVMFSKTDKSTPVIVNDFPIASSLISETMPKLLAAINSDPALRKKLYQIDFLSTLSGKLLITLIYHRQLNEEWIAAAKNLEPALAVHIIGRSRKEKFILSEDFIDEQLTVDGKAYHFRQPEGAFTQPNAKVNRKMLAWAKQHAQQCSGDLLELYCGIGNFTMVLAECFDKVIATEMNKRAVAAAQHNLSTNQISNTEIARLTSEEMTQAMNKVRPFRRLQLANIDLDNYQFETIFVDPPRAGLDDATVDLCKNFKHILYISCNPETLANNLQALHQTHHIKAAALFDQFPYTHHCEAGVWLEKR
jgi:tRNA (uracil-5-)-methyltransferase